MQYLNMKSFVYLLTYLFIVWNDTKRNVQLHNKIYTLNISKHLTSEMYVSF